MKIFTRYNLIARMFPTIIGMIPFFILQYLFLGNVFQIDSISALILGNTGFASILFYALNQYFVRIPSKIYEDWLFNNQLSFPTTEFLLFSDNEYSDGIKNKVREAVLSEFNIQMPTKEDETLNEAESRKRIKEAVRVIIGKVKDGYLVLQHNIEYGFVRNLWGASLVGIVGSVLLIYMTGKTDEERLLGIILGFIYLVYVSFGFVVIKYFGTLYARKLIEEYCNQK